MSNFKNYAATDLDAVFFNVEEFASSAVIEDESVTIVLDNDRMEKRKLKMGEGLQSEELLFYVKKTELSFYPRIENSVIYDNSRWKIQTVQEEEGVFIISIELVSA